MAGTHNATDPSTVPSPKGLGTLVNQTLVLTGDDIQRVKRGFEPYDNTLFAFATESTTLHGDVMFEVVVTLGRNSAVAVITTRYSTAPVASKYVDTVQFRPDDLSWSEPNAFTVKNLPGRLIIDPVGACCLKAWQAVSYQDFQDRTRCLQDTVDPLVALLVYGLAKDSDPRVFLSWQPPYDSVEAAITQKLGNHEDWVKVCEAAKYSGLEKGFCRNLAKLPAPGAQDAAEALASEINRRNRNITLLFGVIGLLSFIVGYLFFNPFDNSSIEGWALCGGGIVLGVGAFLCFVFSFIVVWRNQE